MKKKFWKKDFFSKFFFHAKNLASSWEYPYSCFPAISKQFWENCWRILKKRWKMTIFENVWKLLELADFLQLVQTCSLCYTAFGVKISAQSAKAFTWKLACKHANSWFCIIIVPCFWLIVPFERKYHSFWSKTLIHDVNLMKALRYPFYSSLGTWKIHLGPLDYTQRTPWLPPWVSFIQTKGPFNYTLETPWQCWGPLTVTWDPLKSLGTLKRP